ncbi:META domain-containing protein [Microbulbifer pacificus]|uniref:META domain-containing protein n=1 Tax=Microbulbifer pacificus TaxID=407164 RepID=UPI000CF3B006|nr:META domain-containing protein [Microbulbifer pacificus]
MLPLFQFPRFPIRSQHLTASLLAMSLTFTGCAGNSGPPAAATETGLMSVCEREWILDSLTVDGREHKPRMFWQKMWRDRPYFTCDKLGFVRGNAGSNPYLGKFELRDGGDVHWLKPPKISRMVGRRDSGELEKDFLLAMPRISQARTRGDTLILEGSDGTRLEFRQVGEQATP